MMSLLYRMGIMNLIKAEEWLVSMYTHLSPFSMNMVHTDALVSYANDMYTFTSIQFWVTKLPRKVNFTMR